MASVEPFEMAGAGLEAVGYDEGLQVSFAGEGNARMFRRRAVRRHPDGTAEPVELLVAELNGVRVYVQRRPITGVSIVVSTLDLMP